MTECTVSSSELLSKQSTKLRAIAKIFEGNGDTERPDLVFNAVELSGLSSLLIDVADEIDATRDIIAEDDLCQDGLGPAYQGSATKRTGPGFTEIKKTKDSMSLMSTAAE